jgi:hypothetical protein
MQEQAMRIYLLSTLRARWLAMKSLRCSSSSVVRTSFSFSSSTPPANREEPFEYRPSVGICESSSRAAGALVHKSTKTKQKRIIKEAVKSGILPKPTKLFRSHRPTPRMGGLLSVLGRSRVELEPHVIAERVAAFLPPASMIRPLGNICYSHGGYMAAAPEMLRDPSWCIELSLRTPHAYSLLCRVLLQSGRALNSSRLMAALENNPVLAAYGFKRARALSVLRQQPAVELDVYLSASVCEAVERLYASDVRPSSNALDAIAEDLVQSTLVAHGSALHTICERVFGLSMYRFIALRNGGMTVAAWLNIFTSSVVAGEAPPSSAPMITGGQNSCSGDRISVFLDVKSAAATPRALLLLVRGLNSRGVHVWGVGSFVHRHITLRDEWVLCEQRVMGLPVPLPAPLPLHIFTFAAQIQAACASGRLPQGAHVLFNGGSLLLRGDPAGAPVAGEEEGVAASAPAPGGGRVWVTTPSVSAAVLRELGGIAEKHNLHLGFYTSEPALSAAAATALTACADENRSLFVHGFAYSGVPGLAAADLVPSMHQLLLGVFQPPAWLAALLGVRTTWSVARAVTVASRREKGA